MYPVIYQTVKSTLNWHSMQKRIKAKRICVTVKGITRKSAMIHYYMNWSYTLNIVRLLDTMK